MRQVTSKLRLERVPAVGQWYVAFYVSDWNIHYSNPSPVSSYYEMCLFCSISVYSLWPHNAGLTSRRREMSVYPKHYTEPVILRQGQVLSEEERLRLAKLQYIPIKAALNDQSLSIFHHELANKMINYITRKGKKKLARELLDRCFENIKQIQIQRMNLGREDNVVADPLELLVRAVENCRPILQVTRIKRGGVAYQVPVPVTEKKSYFLAMNWLLDAARDKEKKVHLPEKLAWEIIDAAHGHGRVVKRKNDLHKLCEDNRAYAHYRWS